MKNSKKLYFEQDFEDGVTDFYSDREYVYREKRGKPVRRERRRKGKEEGRSIQRFFRQEAS